MYAEILLHQKITTASGRLTYEIPQNLQSCIRSCEYDNKSPQAESQRCCLKAGDLVEIPLGKKQARGLVWEIHDRKPAIPTKLISKRIYEQILLPWQIKLLEWLAKQPKGRAHLLLKKMVPSQIIQGKVEVKFAEVKNQKTSEEKPVLLISSNQKEKWIMLIEKIQKKIEEGRQILVLTPEIDPFPIWIEKLSMLAKTETYHGKYTEKKRALFWKRVAEEEIKIVVASRLGPFVPLRNLGLIIVTNENDQTYLEDNRPLIHTREIALEMAKLSNCEMIVESPFPSLEIWEKTERENWVIVQPVQEEKIKIIDLREEIKKGNNSPLSDALEEKIRETLSKNEQVILFLNRRGTSSGVLCRDCGYVIRCEKCDMPLTLHKGTRSREYDRNNAQTFGPREGNFLLCHRCKTQFICPTVCPICKNPRIKFLGTGTEKVEEYVKKLFPDTPVVRIDKDTIRNPKELDEASRVFRSGLAKILIGTSMIRIDLLEEVAVLGAVLPDTTLTYPSADSNERTIQQLFLMKSMIKKDGEIFIQTYLPEHPVFSVLKIKNHSEFYKQERRTKKILSML